MFATLVALVGATATKAAIANVTMVPVLTAGATAIGCESPGPCMYKAFRIPGFVYANGTLMAFAEGRATGCDDYSGYHDMVMRRSTDTGATWGDIRVIVDARAFWKGQQATHGLAVWDPTPLYDSTTGETFLFFGGPGRTTGHRRDIWMMSSTDDGQMWTQPQNLSSSCGRPGAPGFFGMAGDTPSDGSGVQLSSGRLVVPMYAGMPAALTVCYSDDHGRTWQVASTPGQDATEGEVVELFPTQPQMAAGPHLIGPSRHTNAQAAAQPHMLYTIRAGACARAESFSPDGGVTWSQAQVAPAPVNVDPGCKGGITRWVGGNALVFANAGSCVGRVNTTVRLSMDNGRTWPHSQVLDAEGGYTTPQMVGDNMIGVLYEQGGCSIALATVDARDVIAATATA